MNIAVIVGGLALLVLLALVIGLMNADERGARNRAWRGIARERRHNWEERRRNRELRESLDCCRDCPFRVPQPEDDQEP